MPKTALTAQAGSAKTLPLLGACSLFLSALEFLIPKPLPFMRIGLANLPLLLALDILPLRSFCALAAVKIVGQALITGGLFSYVFVFSLAGSLSSCAVMLLFRRLFPPRYLSLAGIGLAGAVVSNAAQLVLARFFVFGTGVKYLAPPFLAAGIVSGLALGLFAQHFVEKSQWYRAALSKNPNPPMPDNLGAFLPPPGQKPGYPGLRPPRPASGGPAVAAGGPATPDHRPPPIPCAFFAFFLRPPVLFFIGLVLMICFLVTPSLMGKALQVVLYTVLALLGGKKIRPLVTLCVMAAVVLGNLLVPHGKLLYALGPLQITEGALFAGIRRALTLEGLFMLSAAFVRPGLTLPGRFGSLLAETLSLFTLMQKKARLGGPATVTEKIDALLMELEREPAGGFGGAEAPGEGGA